jgi:hypothetical protein
MKRYLLLSALLFACSSEDNPPTAPDQGVEDQADMRETYPDRYEFCEWREFAPSGELESDLVGDWIVYDFDTDFGSHSIMRIREDGTYVQWQLSQCEEESACFLAGADLCEIDSYGGTWSVDGTNFSVNGYAWPMDSGTLHDLTFGGIDSVYLFLDAATCSDPCLTE